MSDGPPSDFGFGPDEELLRDQARKLLDDRLPVEKLRQLVAKAPGPVYEEGGQPDWDRALWRQMVELGWPGLAVPEAAGGIGFRAVGVAALVEEIGRHAAPSPLLATLQAAYALRSAESEAAEPWLGRIADGAAASLAITNAAGSWEPGDTDVTAATRGGDLVLDGSAHFVQDALKAEWLVVSARGGDQVLLACVPADAPGLAIEPNHIHDLTRDQATLRFEGVRVAPEALVTGAGAAALQKAWPALLMVTSADLCGIAEWQLQTTAEYARTRKQFDRPIGFFQAVKHPLVDAMVMIDRARSLLYHAACCIDFAPDRAEVAARMAKSAASDAGAFASDRSVQLHGGIGFTWESAVHLFFKRSLHAQALWGDGVHQRRKLAERLIDAA